VTCRKMVGAAVIPPIAHDSNFVVLGRISGVFGIQGWLKVYSYTSPRENIFKYTTWQLSDNDDWRSFEVCSHRRQGSGLVASLDGICDRDKAIDWVGSDIAVERAELPRSAAGEYYWADLIGLEVINQQGIVLGTVVRLLDTGAHDVVVVDGVRERLIPYVKGRYIVDVDLECGRLVVDWHPDD